MAGIVNRMQEYRSSARDRLAGRLAELAWWNWDHETLRRALPDFRKLAVEDFLTRYEAAADAAPQARQQGATS